jgi:hypothetical protein
MRFNDIFFVVSRHLQHLLSQKISSNNILNRLSGIFSNILETTQTFDSILYFLPFYLTISFDSQFSNFDQVSKLIEPYYKDSKFCSQILIFFLSIYICNFYYIIFPYRNKGKIKSTISPRQISSFFMSLSDSVSSKVSKFYPFFHIISSKLE